MTKLDLKKSRKALFTAKWDTFARVDVPKVSYLMVDGRGDPNTAPAYREAVESLYSIAYAIKFARKAMQQDFVVAPLEALWWADDPASFLARRKDEWKWTTMIMMPDFVGPSDMADATRKARDKRGSLADTLRLATLKEGLCLQALHIGSFDDEGPLLARLHDEIMPAQGYTFAGPHHEICLSDPRRTSPEKLRTILRQPVQPIG